MQFVIVDSKIEVTHVYPKNTVVGPARSYCIMSHRPDGTSRGIAMEVLPSDPRAAQRVDAEFSIGYTSAEEHQKKSNGRAFVFVTEEGNRLLNHKDPGSGDLLRKQEGISHHEDLTEDENDHN